MESQFKNALLTIFFSFDDIKRKEEEMRFLRFDETSCHELHLFFRNINAAHPCNLGKMLLPLNRLSQNGKFKRQRFIGCNISRQLIILEPLSIFFYFFCLRISILRLQPSRKIQLQSAQLVHSRLKFLR